MFRADQQRKAKNLKTHKEIIYLVLISTVITKKPRCGVGQLGLSSAPIARAHTHTHSRLPMKLCWELSSSRISATAGQAAGFFSPHETLKNIQQQDYNHISKRDNYPRLCTAESKSRYTKQYRFNLHILRVKIVLRNFTSCANGLICVTTASNTARSSLCSLLWGKTLSILYKLLTS